LTWLDGWAKTGAEFNNLTSATAPPRSIDMDLRTALKVLLATTLGLPVAECVLVGVRSLVASMGDAAGADILATLASVCLALWGISVAGLAIVAALVLVVESEGTHRGNDE
jgi:phosphate/sulfate permease